MRSSNVFHLLSWGGHNYWAPELGIEISGLKIIKKMRISKISQKTL
jgi:hypothetical protein